MLPKERINYDIIKQKPLVIFNEEKFNTLSNKMLNESLGSFEEQYQISYEIAHILYNMYINNINEYSYDTHNDIIGKVKINLNTNGLFVKMNASFEGISEDNETVLNVNVGKLKKLFNEDLFIKHATNVIAHELMHSNVIKNKMKVVDGYIEIDSPPNYYDTAVYMMNELDENTIAYWYARGLYVTYYHEMNAIISQTHVQMFNKIGYGKPHTNDEIKKALVKTEPYNIYSTLLYDIIPTIKNMSDDEIFNNIVNVFNDIIKNNGITVNFIKQSLKKMENNAKLALHNVCRNAMIEGKRIDMYRFFIYIF